MTKPVQNINILFCWLGELYTDTDHYQLTQRFPARPRDDLGVSYTMETGGFHTRKGSVTSFGSRVLHSEQDAERQLCSSEELNVKKQKQHQVEGFCIDC